MNHLKICNKTSIIKSINIRGQIQLLIALAAWAHPAKKIQLSTIDVDAMYEVFEPHSISRLLDQNSIHKQEFLIRQDQRMKIIYS
jgi:hypothetical protein